VDSDVYSKGWWETILVNLIIDKSKLFSSDVRAVMLFVSGNDFLEGS